MPHSTVVHCAGHYPPISHCAAETPGVFSHYDGEIGGRMEDRGSRSTASGEHHYGLSSRRRRSTCASTIKGREMGLPAMMVVPLPEGHPRPVVNRLRAPRQSGKTTTVRRLIRRLNRAGQQPILHFSFDTVRRHRRCHQMSRQLHPMQERPVGHLSRRDHLSSELGIHGARRHSGPWRKEHLPWTGPLSAQALEVRRMGSALRHVGKSAQEDRA